LYWLLTHPQHLPLSLQQTISGQHGDFTMEDFRIWLKKAERKELAQVLTRLAQLNQSKVYLFWKKLQS